MYSFREFLDPYVKEYDRFLNGGNLSDTLNFKAQRAVGSDYISKVFRSRARDIKSSYQKAKDSILNPTYSGFIRDNIIRILCLNGVERLIAAYSVAPNMQRQGRPISYNLLLTEIMNEGYRGLLKGLIPSFLHLSTTLFPAMYFTNKSTSESKLLTFVTTYMILDALMYPLDTLKNMMWAETYTPANLREALSRSSLFALYRGFAPRIGFNIPYAAAIYSTTQSQDISYLWWGLTALLYPLHTAKITYQVSNVPKPGQPMYRGLIPFMFLNYFFCWQLTSLFGKEKVESLILEANAELRKQGYSY